jgi:hypothetical protein
MCSLRFESNFLTIEGVGFALILKKTPLSKLCFASVAITTPDPQLFVTRVIFTVPDKFFSCLSEERRSYILDVWSYGVLLWEFGKFNNI